MYREWALPTANCGSFQGLACPKLVKMSPTRGAARACASVEVAAVLGAPGPGISSSASPGGGSGASIWKLRAATIGSVPASGPMSLYAATTSAGMVLSLIHI